MARFIEGQDRHQVTLLPEALDDFIAEDNAVRVVDAFVNELDLAELGFEGVQAAETGRPSYRPTVLLKIYVYGYLNRVQSSRRLERECQRNLEVMWLTGRLAPDFKTIADFRRDNGKGIRDACSRFVELCRHMKLFSQAAVAIDGSKFKAVNSRDRNFTPAKIAARKKQIEESIERYMGELDDADRNHPGEFVAKITRLTDKIKTLREQMRRMDGLQKQLDEQQEAQISLTDADSRSMTSQAKGSLPRYPIAVLGDWLVMAGLRRPPGRSASASAAWCKVLTIDRHESESRAYLQTQSDRSASAACQIADLQREAGIPAAAERCRSRRDRPAYGPPSLETRCGFSRTPVQGARGRPSARRVRRRV